MSNIEKAQAARQVSALNTLTRYHNRAMTRKESIETIVQLEHGKPYTYEDHKIQPMSRKAFFKATQREQDNHAQRMRDAGKKICYAVKMPEGSFFTVPKIAYDYACELYRNESAKEE